MAQSIITFVYDMIKTLAYLFFSAGIAALLAVFTCIAVPEPVLTTLYTVAGVIFSVGMSLAITPKTDSVTNTEKRRDIRKSYQVVRNSFMYMFGVDTLVFIAAEVLKESQVDAFMGIACTLFVIVSIIYFTLNFIELQCLGNDIEEQVLKEKRIQRSQQEGQKSSESK